MCCLNWLKTSFTVCGILLLGILMAMPSLAQNEKKKKEKAPPKVEVPYPPTLPDGKAMVTDTSEDFLKPTSTLRDGVTIAKTPATVDFMFFPGQTYPGNPWSVWGDSIVANGKYYASFGDHFYPGAKSATAGAGQGTAFVFEYDPATKKLRELANVAKILNMPAGEYTPGKIHGRLDMGEDGWIYYSTHRGSQAVTNDKFKYKGDWIFRTNPESGASEIVVQAPVPKHCIPNSVLDPKRMIFYGGTAAGEGKELDDIHFFAYDVKNKKMLYDGPEGPARYMILAKSTGRVYYTHGKGEGVLMRYDPDKGGPPEKIPGTIGIRSATQETPQGFVYTVSNGQGNADATIWSFNTKTEEIQNLGPLAVGKVGYVTSIDVDPTGRYLYYIAGAHGGSELDGTPIVQFDVKTKQKKVIAFLEPFFKKKYGFTLTGTFSSAIDAKGENLYVTWNIAPPGKTKGWDYVGMTAIHIPEGERQP